MFSCFVMDKYTINKIPILYNYMKESKWGAEGELIPLPLSVD